jgi:hypothetical protein
VQSPALLIVGAVTATELRAHWFGDVAAAVVATTSGKAPALVDA